MLEAGLVVSRAFHFLALLVLFGWTLFPRVVRSADPPPRVALVVLALLALVSGAGWFVFTAGSMAGALSDAVSPATLTAVVTQTDFGPLWLARLSLITATLVVVSLRTLASKYAWPSAIMSGVALASLAGTGHARSGDGAFVALHVGADALHLLAAGAWLGGIAGLAVMLMRPLDARAATAARDFAGLGYVAVATLLLSGLINTVMMLDSPLALISTDYGRLLSAKLGLFLAMLALAAANRVRHAPGLASGEVASAMGKLRRNVVAELSFGTAVVAVVSLLGTMAAPGG